MGASGCDCDTGLQAPPDTGPVEFDCFSADGTFSIPCTTPSACCTNSTGQPLCLEQPFCGPPFDCDELVQPTTANSCTFQAPFSQGQIATHLDIAAFSDGTAFVSGYSPGIPTSIRYGDLVIGRVNGSEVEWSIVDGVPDNGPAEIAGVEALESGWRGGVRQAGDNVGEFNSIAINGSTMAISYYDRTNGDLKYASSTDNGATWSIHTVYAAGDSGRYSSLAFLIDGRPAIAFLSMQVRETPGRPRSLPRVVIAGSTAPAAETDWTQYPILAGTVSDPLLEGSEMDCRAELCAEGLACADTGLCMNVSADPDIDCSYFDGDGVEQPGCDVGFTCLGDGAEPDQNFSCGATLTDDYIEDLPIANGIYNSLTATSTGLALVYHDRTRRTMMGADYNATDDDWNGATRNAPFRIDGFDVTGRGDAGYDASLVVDGDGNWLVAYVDAAFNLLKLAVVDATTLASNNPTVTVEQVDDGNRPPRERSIIGADVDMVLTSAGDLRIVYQDQTWSEALLAVRAAGETDWTRQGGNFDAPLDTTDATGFWTAQTLGSGDASVIATWYFNISENRNGTRVFTYP